MKSVFPTVLVLCVVLATASCTKRAAPVPAPASRPPVADAAPPPPPSGANPAPSIAAEAILSEEELFARKTLDQLNAERPLGDVFFDLDRHTLGVDARAVLQQNAEWLRRWTSTRVTIEGHGDARGTSEYNLALAERRANAAREYLVSLGVEGNRLLAVSKGEESPVCVEEHEVCWQQNRRAHPILTSK